MKKTGILLLSALLVVTLVASGLNFTSAFAQTSNQQVDNGDMRRTIQVSGSGSASAQPDTAVIVVGVRTEADEASAALTENNQQASDLIDALQAAGIAEDDIQTQYLNLSPRYGDSPTPGGQPEVTGYVAINTLQVRVRDITEVGQILDTAVGAGGNLIEGIHFEVSDQDEVLQQAREAAFTNARQKAEQLADLAGVQLGELISIAEVSSSPPLPFAAGGAQAEDMAVPVEPGSQNIQVNLQVTWEISGGQAQAGNTLTPIVPQTGETVTATRTRTPIVQQTQDVTVTPATPQAGDQATATTAATRTPIVETAAPLASTTPMSDSGSSAIEQLRAEGATVRQIGTIRQPFLPVAGQLVEVNREQIQVFVFDSNTDAQQSATLISQSADDLSGLTGLITAHFFHEGDSIILYTGNDTETLALLSQVFGDELAE